MTFCLFPSKYRQSCQPHQLKATETQHMLKVSELYGRWPESSSYTIRPKGPFVQLSFRKHCQIREQLFMSLCQLFPRDRVADRTDDTQG